MPFNGITISGKRRGHYPTQASKRFAPIGRCIVVSDGTRFP